MIYVLLSAAIVAADQWFKGWISANLAYGGEVTLIPGLLRLTNVQNTGAAFSLFQGMQPLILIITGLFCAVALLALVTKSVKGVFGNLTVAMILGGALGNALDRSISGYVVDMFDFIFMRFAVFNVADCFITFGAVMLCIYILILGRKDQKDQKVPISLRGNENPESQEAEITIEGIMEEFAGSDAQAGDTGKETAYDPDHSGD